MTPSPGYAPVAGEPEHARGPRPVKLYVGDTWSFAYTYRGPNNSDGTPGQPIICTGSTITALLYLAYQAAPIPLPLSADADTNLALGKFKPVASGGPTGITASAVPDPQGARTFPTRLVVVITDSLGNETTLGKQPIHVVSR